PPTAAPHPVVVRRAPPRRAPRTARSPRPPAVRPPGARPRPAPPGAAAAPRRLPRPPGAPTHPARPPPSRRPAPTIPAAVARGSVATRGRRGASPVGRCPPATLRRAATGPALPGPRPAATPRHPGRPWPLPPPLRSCRTFLIPPLTTCARHRSSRAPRGLHGFRGLGGPALRGCRSLVARPAAPLHGSDLPPQVVRPGFVRAGVRRRTGLTDRRRRTGSGAAPAAAPSPVPG